MKCDHIKTARQAYFFPWTLPEHDVEIKYFDGDEADKCPHCKKTNNKGELWYEGLV